MKKLSHRIDTIRSMFAPAMEQQEKSKVFANLHESLLLADSGTTVAKKIVEQVKVYAGANPDHESIEKAIQQTVSELLLKLDGRPIEQKTKPHVIMMVGTNGGGKTTTVAKLASHAVKEDKTVILAAADSFRAAAEQQLEVLAARLGDKVRVIRGEKDPGATAFNSVSAGIAAKADLVIIDTAGRQPSSVALMAEVSKINNAVAKSMAGAPHEKLLAIDANTGQNALRQAEAFDDLIGLDGCILTKLDSTARGGIILALASYRPIPIRYIGIGEGVDDLVEFSSSAFAEALFSQY